MVGYSGRDIKAVAPNSPIEIVKANMVATNNGKSMARKTRLGDAPRTAADWRRRG